MALQNLYNVLNHPLTWDDVNEVLKIADDNFTFVASATTTGDLSAISQDIIPDGLQNWDIGSADKPWDNLFVNNISVGTIDADLVGSVFSDGSTMLVDGTNGLIVGNVQNASVSSDSITANNLSVNAQSRIGEHWPFSNGADDIGRIGNTYRSIYATTLIGNVDGNVTGDVSGNVTGNVTGNLTGNVTGNVIGNLTGNVSGDLTGSVWSDDSSGLLIDGTEGTINTHKLAQVSATDGQALVWSNSNSRWEPGTVSGSGVSLGSRVTKSASTGSLANGATGNTNVLDAFKGYALLKVQTSAAAWVRIYVSEAARTADAGRLESEDPAADAGVIAEVITTGAETVLVSPGVFGFNDESPVTTTIPLAVTNKSGGTTVVSVTLTLVQLEA